MPAEFVLRDWLIKAACGDAGHVAEAWKAGAIDRDLGAWPPELVALLPLALDSMIESGVPPTDLAMWAGIARHAWVRNQSVLAAVNVLADTCGDVSLSGDFPLVARYAPALRFQRPRVLVPPTAMNAVLDSAQAHGWNISAPGGGRAGAWVTLESRDRIELLPCPKHPNRASQDANAAEFAWVELLATTHPRCVEVPARSVVLSVLAWRTEQLDVNTVASELRRRRCTYRALKLADALDSYGFEQGARIRDVVTTTAPSRLERAEARLPGVVGTTVSMISDSRERGTLRGTSTFLAHRWSLSRRRDIPAAVIQRMRSRTG